MYSFRRKGPATVKAIRLEDGKWRVEFRSGLAVIYDESDFLGLYEPATSEAINYLADLKKDPSIN